MRYVYSILRFVPDPVRGEFVNVGAVVGSDDSSEWEIRVVEGRKRARAIDEKGLLPLVWTFIDDLERKVDAFSDSIELLGLGLDAPPISEGWLKRLAEESRNVVQLSSPAVVVASTAEEAMRLIFEQLVFEPEARRYRFQKKYTALAAVRRAYKDHGLLKDQNFVERATVRGRHHKERFDFVVGNGRALQLAQTWSFQIPDQDDLSEAIKAWAWTVRDIRDHGGEARTEERVVEVPRQVDVEVVYVPPMQGGARAVLEEALAAFNAIEVRAFSTTEAGRVGMQAEQLLRRAGR